MADNNEEPGLSPRARIPRINAAPESRADPAHLAQLADLMDSVKLLAGQLGSSPDDPPENAQDRSARRTKKFQRSGAPEERRSEPLPAATPAAPETVPGDSTDGEDEAALPIASAEADPTALNKSIAWPSATRPARPAGRGRAPRKRPPSTAPLMVLMAVNLGVLILGYWFGQAAAGGAPRNAAPPSAYQPLAAVDPVVLQGVSDRAAEAANAALKAEKSGDADTARRLYTEAVEQRVGLPGAEYRLALLAVKRGDLLDADLHLVHSLNNGENVAACYYVRSTFAGAKGNFAEAARQLAAASRAEPFSAKYFFYWGEALRRQGKPQAAIPCFEQALDRPYNPDEGAVYLFKQRLARLESGQDDQFNASLATTLGQPPVAGDWWLLAAAQDLTRSNYAAAADHLQKATHAMSPGLFESRVRDFLFRSNAKRPELAVYFNRANEAPPPEAGRAVMDPSSWFVEKGDPGNWPSAGSSGR